MTTGQIVLTIVVLAVVGFAVYRARTDGRFTAATTPVAKVADSPVAEALKVAGVDVLLGEKATLVQFSTTFCAPCRATRRVLGEVTGVVPGVVHLDVDAEAHLELVRELRILRTPTTLVLDRFGHERARAAGLPTKDQVLATLGNLD